MIPLRDENPPSRFPVVTYSLITLNVLIFIYMIGLPESALAAFYEQYALIPGFVTHGQMLHTLFTSAFMHGGFGHILGNMLFFHIFGDNIEDRIGRLPFILFYLLCGLAAAGAQIVVDPDSAIPMVGASGAIAGLMGGYLRLFPTSRVLTLFIFGYFSRLVYVPAYFMLIYWIFFEIINGVGSLGYVSQGGVAYFAHIGGFLSGWILISIFPRQTPNH